MPCISRQLEADSSGWNAGEFHPGEVHFYHKENKAHEGRRVGTWALISAGQDSITSLQQPG
jgi:hypothetical protein